MSEYRIRMKKSDQQMMRRQVGQRKNARVAVLRVRTLLRAGSLIDCLECTAEAQCPSSSREAFYDCMYDNCSLVC